MNPIVECPNRSETTFGCTPCCSKEFDTSLFGLPWNNILVGSKLTREIITEADSNFKGNRSRLQNWYANYNKETHIQNIIHCQRANLSWGWRLRQGYCNFILLMISILFFGEAIFALVQNKSFYEYVVELFIPSIPIVGIVLESIIEHKVLVKDKKEKEQEVSSLLDGSQVDLETARRLQDIIFTFRTSTAIIPEYFYKIFWKRFDNTMHNSID
ncbi:S-4TM family putative pore-forming effector [Neobacillus sp. NPDC093182]|uniref:S-4TM family putative pore-forming effector n=1 Tax=Neobacillus sp. NPDC093182 TaxID=3364297 RepID=UPI0037F84059